jgi:hypothetical protein
MHHESSRTEAIEAGSIEQAVLAMLLDGAQQRPWSTAEVRRAVGDEIAATDALANPRADGLIHRFGHFVFASRAAVRADELRL